MPYNTTAIPPRKEVTGQTQLPLSRVKKIVAVDPDVSMCSNNAAFAITLATEIFIQYMAEQGQNMAKLERKPRRNIQYKDLANAIAHQDNLEFLTDVVPKTASYKQVRDQAAATRAQLKGEKSAAAFDGSAATAATNGRSSKAPALPNGNKKQKSIVNGDGSGLNGFSSGPPRAVLADEEELNAQLETEMRQAQSQGDGDIDMTG